MSLPRDRNKLSDDLFSVNATYLSKYFPLYTLAILRDSLGYAIATRVVAFQNATSTKMSRNASSPPGISLPRSYTSTQQSPVS